MGGEVFFIFSSYIIATAPRFRTPGMGMGICVFSAPDHRRARGVEIVFSSSSSSFFHRIFAIFMYPGVAARIRTVDDDPSPPPMRVLARPPARDRKKKMKRETYRTECSTYTPKPT